MEKHHIQFDQKAHARATTWLNVCANAAAVIIFMVMLVAVYIMLPTIK